MPYLASTSHVVWARWTLPPFGDIAIATEEILLDDVWHIPALLDDAGLSAGWANAVLSGGSLTLRIANRSDYEPTTGSAAYESMLTPSADGIPVTVGVVTTVTWSDGSVETIAESQRLTCIARSRGAGFAVMELTDIEDARLNALYPAETYSTTDFPDLSDNDAGRAMPAIVGVATKVPLAQIVATDPWDHVIGRRAIASGVLTVLNWYRGASPSQARLASGGTPALITHAGENYFTLLPGAEQRDFNGSKYNLYADVQTTARTPSEVIRALLTAAGCTPDTTSFSAANTYLLGLAILVDCDFGAWGQRTIRAIIEDLLWVARAALYRMPNGDYGILCDQPGSVVATFDETSGDDIEIIDLREEARPSKVGIKYRPSPRDPSALQFELARPVTGGTQAVERPRELRYVRRHDVADKTICYYALRAAHAARLRARIYRTALSLGDVIKVSSAAFALAPSDWRIRKIQRISGGIEIEAEPYSSSIFTYTPGALPGDAGVDYTPDYSSTPPAAPTSLRITAGSVALSGDGATTARVTVDAIPPTVNWDRIQFSAVHNVTGEIPGILRGSSVGGGRQGVVLTGLRPGETYKLLAWAENAYNVQGVVQSTFNATAIGGGASVTTFVAPGYATVPSDVASISRVQGMGRMVEVSWSAVSTANLRDYVLERSVNAGAYTQIWNGAARSYIDRDVAYGSNYAYRVKARDLWGNLSTNWRTSTGLSLSAGTVLGGASGNDIGSSTVATANRTAVTGVSVSYTNIDGLTMQTQSGLLTKTVAHSLGKTPVVGGGVFAGAGAVTVVAANPTSSNIGITAIGNVAEPTGVRVTAFSATYVQSELNTHTHRLNYNIVGNGDTGTVYIW